jgi:hypothetical protein
LSNLIGTCNILRKSIKLTNVNFKINKSLVTWGALALRVALQIISIFFDLRDFLPVENQNRGFAPASGALPL